MKYLYNPITIEEFLTSYAFAVIALRTSVSHTVYFQPISLKLVISAKQLEKLHSLSKSKSKLKVTKFLKKYIFKNLMDLQKFNLAPVGKENVADEVQQVNISGYGLSNVDDVFVSCAGDGDYVLSAKVYPFISFEKTYPNAKLVTDATDTTSVIDAEAQAEVEAPSTTSPEKVKPKDNKNKGK